MIRLSIPRPVQQVIASTFHCSSLQTEFGYAAYSFISEAGYNIADLLSLGYVGRCVHFDSSNTHQSVHHCEDASCPLTRSVVLKLDMPKSQKIAVMLIMLLGSL